VLSGPSAVGKSTVVRCVRDRVPDLYFSVSVTTRAPRPGEVDGVDYQFVSAEMFQRLIDDGALLEWADIHGGLHRSGTPAQPVRDAVRGGHPVLIEVDLAGARAIKRVMPEVGGSGGTVEEARHRKRGCDAAPAGHRPRGIGSSDGLRRSGGEQRIGVGVRRIDSLTWGNRAGHGVSHPQNPLLHSQETVFREYFPRVGACRRA
jgi:Guanylate kinase